MATTPRSSALVTGEVICTSRCCDAGAANDSACAESTQPDNMMSIPTSIVEDQTALLRITFPHPRCSLPQAPSYLWEDGTWVTERVYHKTGRRAKAMAPRLENNYCQKARDMLESCLNEQASVS